MWLMLGGKNELQSEKYKFVLKSALNVTGHIYTKHKTKADTHQHRV